MKTQIGWIFQRGAKRANAAKEPRPEGRGPVAPALLHTWLFRKVVIYCSGTEGEYLHRYKLLGSNDLFAVYVHNFIEPDVPVFHDHPWDFLSIILAGGYTEHRPGHPDRVRRRFSVAYRAAEAAHWADQLHGDTWTLILRFRRRREWGFWTAEGWLPWREYVRVKRPRNHSEYANA